MSDTIDFIATGGCADCMDKERPSGPDDVDGAGFFGPQPHIFRAVYPLSSFFSLLTLEKGRDYKPHFFKKKGSLKLRGYTWVCAHCSVLARSYVVKVTSKGNVLQMLSTHMHTNTKKLCNV